MAEQNIRPRNFTDPATDSDLQNADNYLWLDTANKAKKLEITRLAVFGDTAATEADMVADSKIPIMTAAGPKSLPGNTIAKASEQAALTTYAQNVAHSIAQEFDPTKPNDAGGYAYYAGEIVTNNGTTYRFKVNHPSGAWNDADVDLYVAGESLKFFVVTNNPEYLYAVTDRNGAFIFGVKKGGDIEWAVGVPLPVRRYVASKVDKEDGKSLINSIFADGVSVIENPEYLSTITDSSGNILFGFRKDGDVVFGYGVPSSIKAYVNKIAGHKVDKETGKSLIDEIFAGGVSVVQNPEYMQVFLDALNRTILGVRDDGSIVFKAPVSFDNIKWSQDNLYQLDSALKELGLIRGVGDQSEKKSLHIPMPKFCVINFSNILQMPLTKTEDAHAIMEFWDNSGNYFKKNVIANAQGTSSLAFIKKNVSIDICNDEWIGDDTFKLKLGEWVEQDSFHLKAYYTDFFRGVSIPAYNLYKRILDTRGNDADRTWKLALNIDPNNYGQGLGYGEPSGIHNRIDNGALCFPQGLPALVYLNGEFYGVFSWNLKKHRDNYHMDKSNENNIHLDGILGADFFSGNIDWTDFEVRNPKKLICMDGSDYDGDNPTELIDSSSEAYNPNNSKHVFTASVKAKIIALSTRTTEINAAATTDAKKAIFEKYFNRDNLIDYQIFSDVVRNADGFRKNWQWTTWDGEKWFVNAYDLDESFGAYSSGNAIFAPLRARLGLSTDLPSGIMQRLYLSELEDRYALLRDLKIVDYKVITDSISSWCKTIGERFFKLEYDKWTDSPCNRDMVMANQWELILDENGRPVVSYSADNEYDGTATYSAGDVVQFTLPGNGTWWYNFKCLSSVQGVEPVERWGFRDNLWRVENWLRISIENMDGIYNYNN
jgi:hypothetical protein